MVLQWYIVVKYVTPVNTAGAVLQLMIMIMMVMMMVSKLMEVTCKLQRTQQEFSATMANAQLSQMHSFCVLP